MEKMKIGTLVSFELLPEGGYRLFSDALGVPHYSCPHCGREQNPTAHNTRGFFHYDATVPSTAHSSILIGSRVAVCSNTLCNKPTVWSFWGSNESNSAYIEVMHIKRVYPETDLEINLHESVPAQIREDFREAQLIKELSSKSSATLCRRCIEAMIRDFCEIDAGTLYKSIEELNSRLKNNNVPAGVHAHTVKGLSGIRQFGNVGAHMQDNANLIVDVSAQEAQMLIMGVQMISDDWYKHRFESEQHLNKLLELGNAKQVEKKNAE